MEEENIEIGKDMSPILLEDLGMRFPTEKSKRKDRYGLYQCQYCGKEFEAQIQNIRSGNTISCGCQSDKYKNPHGLTKHPLYQTYFHMKVRCYNPKNKSYNNYGGRGIKVCERWMDISNFIEDMYPSYHEGLSIDRIDVDGNYEPDNCRWASLNTQMQNTRDICKNNTSGYRGVSWDKRRNEWEVQIMVENKRIRLGYHQTALEGAKAYERYVRVNNLEHNFTPALTEAEIEELRKQNDQKNI